MQHDTQDVFPFLGCQSIAYPRSPWTSPLTQASLWTDRPLYIGQARAGCRSFSYLPLYPLCSVGVLTLPVHLGSQQALPPFTHAVVPETRPLAAIMGLKPQLTQTDLLQISLLYITRPWPSYEKRFWWEAASLLTAILAYKRRGRTATSSLRGNMAADALPCARGGGLRMRRQRCRSSAPHGGAAPAPSSLWLRTTIPSMPRGK